MYLWNCCQVIFIAGSLSLILILIFYFLKYQLILTVLHILLCQTVYVCICTAFCLFNFFQPWQDIVTWNTFFIILIFGSEKWNGRLKDMILHLFHHRKVFGYGTFRCVRPLILPLLCMSLFLCICMFFIIKVSLA